MIYHIKDIEFSIEEYNYIIQQVKDVFIYDLTPQRFEYLNNIVVRIKNNTTKSNSKVIFIERFKNLNSFFRLPSCIVFHDKEIISKIWSFNERCHKDDGPSYVKKDFYTNKNICEYYLFGTCFKKHKYILLIL